MTMPPRILWDQFDSETPTADEPQTASELLKAFRYWTAEANHQAAVILELQRRLVSVAGNAPTEQETAAAAAIKAEVVATLREMLPQAKRAAKRGKPALLRLIVRTIRTKL